jgi:type II secretory pathway predicted ATPase ExeA
MISIKQRQFEHAVWDLYENQQKTAVVIIDEAHLLEESLLG